MALRRMLSELPLRFGYRAVAETEFCLSSFKLLSTTRILLTSHLKSVVLNLASGYKFAKTHEWVDPKDPKEIKVGISKFAQVLAFDDC